MTPALSQSDLDASLIATAKVVGDIGERTSLDETRQALALAAARCDEDAGRRDLNRGAYGQAADRFKAAADRFAESYGSRLHWYVEEMGRLRSQCRLAAERGQSRGRRYRRW